MLLELFHVEAVVLVDEGGGGGALGLGGAADAGGADSELAVAPGKMAGGGLHLSRPRPRPRDAVAQQVEGGGGVTVGEAGPGGRGGAAGQAGRAAVVLPVLAHHHRHLRVLLWLEKHGVQLQGPPVTIMGFGSKRSSRLRLKDKLFYALLHTYMSASKKPYCCWIVPWVI